MGKNRRRKKKKRKRINPRSKKSISISEIKSFLACRLRWSLSAAPPRGRGLRSSVKSPALFLGSIIHEALQIWYDFPEKELTEIYWELVEKQTLNDSVLFQESTDKIIEQRELGAAMLQIYQDYQPIIDKDTYIIATETSWSGVKVPGTQATLSGIFDAVIKRPDGLWILDFKTTKSTYTDWTHQDLQATAYVYAARQLYGPEVKGIIFRFLLKKKPYDYHKLILKNGSVTKRKNLSSLTTYRQYLTSLAISNLKSLVNSDLFDLAAIPSLDLPTEITLSDYAELISEVKDYPVVKQAFKELKQQYFTQLQELKGAWRNWIWDVYEQRSDIQIQNYLNTVIVPTMNQCISKKVIVGPTGLSTAWATCGRCQFKSVCRLAMDGGNYEEYLADDFVVSERYLSKKEKTKCN